VSDAFDLLRAYGLTVRFTDLGDWGRAELLSEYDPEGPEIRINRRVAARLSSGDLESFVALAIGHELYHHREAIGEVAVIHDRVAREAAAQAYARELAETLR
jgi:hypothetical protein